MVKMYTQLGKKYTIYNDEFIRFIFNKSPQIYLIMLITGQKYIIDLYYFCLPLPTLLVAVSFGFHNCAYHSNAINVRFYQRLLTRFWRKKY